jgi:hypothetical protein
MVYDAHGCVDLRKQGSLRAVDANFRVRIEQAATLFHHPCLHNQLEADGDGLWNRVSTRAVTAGRSW